MKKSLKLGVFVILSLLVLSFLVGVGSAANPDDPSVVFPGSADSSSGIVTTNSVGSILGDYSSKTSAFLSELSKNLNPVIKWVLGDVVVPSNLSGKIDAGEMLLVKLLVFILMLTIIYYAAGKVPMFSSNNKVVWLVAVVIGILATRFLTTAALVNFAWFPSGVLGIALVCLIPFIIFFFFVQSFEDYRIIRQICWVFFAILFLFLAILRWNNTQTGPEWWENLSWIYIITVVVSIIMLYFDKNIQAMFAGVAIKRKSDLGTRNQLTKIQEQIEWAKEVIATAPGANIPTYTWGTYPLATASGPKQDSHNKEANKFINEQEKTIRRLLKT